MSPTTWIIGGVAVVAAVAFGAAWFLFGELGDANQAIGGYKAGTEIITDANKGKVDATKERARTERDVRDLPDPALIDGLR